MLMCVKLFDVLLYHRGRQARGQPVARGRRVGGGHDAKEERTYELKDVLVGAAIKAGAKAPLKPDKIKLLA